MRSRLPRKLPAVPELSADFRLRARDWELIRRQPGEIPVIPDPPARRPWELRKRRGSRIWQHLLLMSVFAGGWWLLFESGARTVVIVIDECQMENRRGQTVIKTAWTWQRPAWRRDHQQRFILGQVPPTISQVCLKRGDRICLRFEAWRHWFSGRQDPVQPYWDRLLDPAEAEITERQFGEWSENGRKSIGKAMAYLVGL